tara:strand:+ start:305 stop:409 length:105 start_codon:yes stop_codon:yes gene_type:complete
VIGIKYHVVMASWFYTLIIGLQTVSVEKYDGVSA